MIFFKHISQSVFFSAIVNIFIILAFISNIILTAILPSDKVWFNGISNIQKDVFAAVFFISDTAAEIGASIAGVITPKKDSDKKDEAQPGRTAQNNADKLMLQPNFDVNSKTIKSQICSFWIDCCLAAAVLIIYDKHRTYDFLLFYFAVMLLFFISVINTHDSARANSINVFARPALFKRVFSLGVHHETIF